VVCYLDRFHTSSTQALRRTAQPRRRSVAFDPSNECSKCPWSHARSVETHRRGSHIKMPLLTTTKLSKNTRPTRGPNWRKHRIYHGPALVSTAPSQIPKRFFQFQSGRPRPRLHPCCWQSELYRPMLGRQPTPKLFCAVGPLSRRRGLPRPFAAMRRPFDSALQRRIRLLGLTCVKKIGCVAHVGLIGAGVLRG
jgi:hypothetical protein